MTILYNEQNNFANLTEADQYVINLQIQSIQNQEFIKRDNDGYTKSDHDFLPSTSAKEIKEAESKKHQLKVLDSIAKPRSYLNWADAVKLADKNKHEFWACVNSFIRFNFEPFFNEALENIEKGDTADRRANLLKAREVSQAVAIIIDIAKHYYLKKISEKSLIDDKEYEIFILDYAAEKQNEIETYCKNRVNLSFSAISKQASQIAEKYKNRYALLFIDYFNRDQFNSKNSVLDAHVQKYEIYKLFYDIKKEALQIDPRRSFNLSKKDFTKAQLAKDPELPIKKKIEQFCKKSAWQRALLNSINDDDSSILSDYRILDFTSENTQSAIMSVQAWRRRQDWRAYSILQQKATVISATDDVNEAYSIFDIAKNTIANPVIFANEMSLRSGALTEICMEKGWFGVMLTLTLPSRFHKFVTVNGKKDVKGRRKAVKNKKYDPLLSDRDGARLLIERWGKVRKEADKNGIKLGAGYEFIRNLEFHKDGTAHMHVMVFSERSNLDKFVFWARKHFLFSDSPNEHGALKHRVRADFSAENDAKKLTAYVMKMVNYVTKEMREGKGEETYALAQARILGVRLIEMSQHNITVWRMLRRIKDPRIVPTVLLESWHAAHGLSHLLELPFSTENLKTKYKDLSTAEISALVKKLDEDHSCKIEHFKLFLKDPVSQSVKLDGAWLTDEKTGEITYSKNRAFITGVERFACDRDPKLKVQKYESTKRFYELLKTLEDKNCKYQQAARAHQAELESDPNYWENERLEYEAYVESEKKRDGEYLEIRSVIISDVYFSKNEKATDLLTFTNVFLPQILKQIDFIETASKLVNEFNLDRTDFDLTNINKAKLVKLNTEELITQICELEASHVVHVLPRFFEILKQERHERISLKAKELTEQFAQQLQLTFDKKLAKSDERFQLIETGRQLFIYSQVSLRSAIKSVFELSAQTEKDKIPIPA